MELAVAHHDHPDHHHNFIMLGSSSSSTDLTHLIVKGKRTRRQRSSSPSSCSSSRQLELGLVVANYGSTSINSASSPATTSSTNDQEQDQVVVQEEEVEEDMANCLILLAQGHHHHHHHNNNNNNKKQALYPRKKIEKLPPPPPAIITKSGFYVYECKTCNRTFPSFQALGGHRASHKKPKLGGAGGDEKKGNSVNTGDVEGNCQLNKSCSDHHPQLLPQLPNNNSSKGSGGNNLNFQLRNSNSHKGNKMHECSICGSEFMSGQALGGHMRRHRAAAAAPPNSSVDGDSDGDQKEMIRPRRVMLGLDLNLPAPEDEQQMLPQQSKFQFVSSKQQTPSLLVAAPALVDCQY